MKLGIAQRVWLVVGLLLVLFFTTSAVSFVLTKRIQDDVARLARVNDLREDAVIEMESHLAEIARTVHAYAFDREASDRESALASAAEFELSAAAFARLTSNEEHASLGEQVFGVFDEFKELGDDIRVAVTDELRSLRALAVGDSADAKKPEAAGPADAASGPTNLAQQVAGVFGEFNKLGAEIITVTDKERAELVPLRAKMRAIDESIERRIQRSVSGGNAWAADKMKAVLGMDDNIDANICNFEAYLDSRTRGDRDGARLSEAAFNLYAVRFRETDLSGEEQTWVAQISDDFAAVTKASGGVMDLVDRKRNLLASFEVQRERIEELFGARIFPLLDKARKQAERKVNASTNIVTWFLVGITR